MAAVSKACFFHICHIRASLPDDVAWTVVCSIVGSRLDYCNSLLAGKSESNFHKLQCVRVVSGKTRHDHITPVLRELRWLPVCSQVSFKLAMLVLKIRQTGILEYLTPCVPAYMPTRTLCSSSHCLLITTAMGLVTWSRSFSHSAATVWNNLPTNVRQCDYLETFKRHLKTHLFNIVYNTWTGTIWCLRMA